MIEGIENAYPNYGLPKKKKYPLPDRKHVLSAIRFFNYVSPRDEKQLAEAILEKIKEYGMKDVGVGPDNRFLKYYKRDADHLQHHGIKGQQWGVHNVSSYPMQSGNEVKINKGVVVEMDNYKIIRNGDCLQHHGIPGQKWGIRRFQNEDGSLTNEGKARYGQQRGYEARQMYKRGAITREEYKSRMKPDSVLGKIDNVMNIGLGRRAREFNQRHKRGLIAFSSVMSGISGAANSALRGQGPLGMAVAAGTSAAAGALLTFGGLAINDFIVDKAYNQR